MHFFRFLHKWTKNNGGKISRVCYAGVRCFFRRERPVKRNHSLAAAVAVLALVSSLTLGAFAQKHHTKANSTAATETAPAAAEIQPAQETIDLGMYQRIMDEGFHHSHVMDYASALDDDIGPRLTGSPNLAKANDWTKNQLTAMGCANAHLESWGVFGMGWEQLNTWVRMVTPDPAVLIAQATPWSPATNGPMTGSVVHVNVQEEKDLDQYKGKLASKIVLLGDMRPVPPVDKPLWTRYTDAELEAMTGYPRAGGGGCLQI